MSAWRLSLEHIALMVDLAEKGPVGCKNWYALTWDDDGKLEKGNTTGMTTVGQMLDQTNEDSIMARYNDPEYAEVGRSKYAATKFKNLPRLTVGEAFKLIACYEYQSCEHDGWKTSEAKKFCQALTNALTSQVEGYDAAPWGWGPEEIKARKTITLSPVKQKQEAR